MAFEPQTAKDFNIISSNEIVHRVTGATFSRYPAPTESTDMWVNRKLAGDGMPDGEEYWEAINAAARKILFTMA